MAFFSADRRRERDEAERLYSAVAAAARHPAFYTRFRVPDTFAGRFEVLVLHLVPVVRRLALGRQGDPDLARRVTESFVTDLDDAVREAGVGDLSVGKRVKALFGSYGGRLATYTQAGRGGEAALADAIARNVYAGAAPPGAAPALAGWLKATLANFDTAGIDSLRQGRLPFADPADGRGEWTP
jgi:cytochrome b pre-mRNA-processing protein 3